jgi:hypothetical protein
MAKVWFGSEVTDMRKKCQCKGTSSGPRYIVKAVPVEGGHACTVDYVYHACDVCDEPWIVYGKKDESLV